MGFLRMIDRHSRYRFLDPSIGDEEQDATKRFYCQRCLNLPIRRLARLTERQYPNLKADDPLPPDHDNWMQCPACGTVYPIYNVKPEGRLQLAHGYIPDNPFDMNQQYIGGVHKGRSLSRLEERRKAEKYADIKDPDARDMIKSGKKLISYRDSSQ